MDLGNSSFSLCDISASLYLTDVQSFACQNWESLSLSHQLRGPALEDVGSSCSFGNRWLLRATMSCIVNARHFLTLLIFGRFDMFKLCTLTGSIRTTVSCIATAQHFLNLLIFVSFGKCRFCVVLTSSIQSPSLFLCNRRITFG